VVSGEERPLNNEKKIATMERAAGIVAAYVGGNGVSMEELPGLIRSTYAALKAIERAPEDARSPAGATALEISQSIKPHALVCFEDGLEFKSLRRHLSTRHDLSPEAYRAKWGLPRDYPMTAPRYSAIRKQLAKQYGFQEGRAKPAKASRKGRKAAVDPTPDRFTD